MGIEELVVPGSKCQYTKWTQLNLPEHSRTSTEFSCHSSQLGFETFGTNRVLSRIVSLGGGGGEVGVGPYGCRPQGLGGLGYAPRKIFQF